MEQVQSTKAARTHLPGKAKVGFAILAVYVLLGVFGPILLPFDPDKANVLQRLKPPSSTHWLGTDQLGRDFLIRLLYAIRLDIPVAFAAAFNPYGAR